mgnify:CR=1 FL=1
MTVINNNVQEEQVGGAWACWIGCGTFCLMGGGTVSFIAAVATAL